MQHIFTHTEDRLKFTGELTGQLYYIYRNQTGMKFAGFEVVTDVTFLRNISNLPDYIGSVPRG
jgi:hypothetical protein